MRYALSIGCFFLALLVWRCSGGEHAGAGMAGGASPEEVLRRYQACVDSNHFEEAKELSTPREQARLNKLARIIAEDLLDSTVLTTRFLNIDCRQQDDVTYCYCLVEDQYERYETEFRLVRAGGRWLVDAPDEDFRIEDEVIEDMIDGKFQNDRNNR